MADNDNKYIAAKIIPHNELAVHTKMTFEDMVKGLSDLQDELYLRGFSESAQLLHRAMQRLTTCAIGPDLQNRLAEKKRNTT